VLHSEKDDKFYTGYISNLKERLTEHYEGMVASTKSRRPLKI
jgi:predicted GIY-YIG superfamily endonuclease